MWLVPSWSLHEPNKFLIQLLSAKPEIIEVNISSTYVRNDQLWHYSLADVVDPQLVTARAQQVPRRSTNGRIKAFISLFFHPLAE
jgi:hypothetical protein